MRKFQNTRGADNLDQFADELLSYKNACKIRREEKKPLQKKYRGFSSVQKRIADNSFVYTKETKQVFTDQSQGMVCFRK
jgi:hypothetical protein